MEESKIKYFDAHTPALDELAAVLQDGLKNYFADVKVELVDCPDFSKKPYKIAVGGLHGKPSIADVGGGKFINRPLSEPSRGCNRDHLLILISTSPQFDPTCQSRVQV